MVLTRHEVVARRMRKVQSLVSSYHLSDCLVKWMCLLDFRFRKSWEGGSFRHGLTVRQQNHWVFRLKSAFLKCKELRCWGNDVSGTSETMQYIPGSPVQVIYPWVWRLITPNHCIAVHNIVRNDFTALESYHGTLPASTFFPRRPCCIDAVVPLKWTWGLILSLALFCVWQISCYQVALYAAWFIKL